MLLFLKENGHLDVANQERMTPLMNAASKNNVEVARELIELGADVNKQRDLPFILGVTTLVVKRHYTLPR